MAYVLPARIRHAAPPAMVLALVLVGGASPWPAPAHALDPFRSYDRLVMSNGFAAAAFNARRSASTRSSSILSLLPAVERPDRSLLHGRRIAKPGLRRLFGCAD